MNEFSTDEYTVETFKPVTRQLNTSADLSKDDDDLIIDDEGADEEASLVPDNKNPTFVDAGIYRMDPKRGLYFEAKSGKGDEAQIIKTKVCGPFEVIGNCRTQTGEGWSLLVQVTDPDGKLHKVEIAPSEILDTRAACVKLMSAGLDIAFKQQSRIPDYLLQARAKTKTRVRQVAQTGWTEFGLKDGKISRVFVMPNRIVGNTGGEEIYFDAIGAHTYAEAGTFEQWQEHVAKPAGQFPLPRFAISAALSGSLLKILGQEGCLINYVGPSSRGKTTLMQVAASTQGRGEVGYGIRQWSLTSNAVEAVCEMANDACLYMDEIGSAPNQDFGALIYSLCGGVGKARLSRNAEMREVRRWRIIMQSSGEIGIATKIKEGHAKIVKAGHLSRAADIPLNIDNELGVFDAENLEGDAGARTKSIGNAATRYYGTALPTYIERLIAEGITDKDIQSLSDRFVISSCPFQADGQVTRMATRFGIIAAAGEIGIKLGVLPWPEGSAFSAAEDAFDRWLYQRGDAGSYEEKTHVEKIRTCIELYGEARFVDIKNIAEQSRVTERYGYRETISGKTTYWILPQAFEKICEPLNKVDVARTLAKHGMLRRTSTKALTVSKRIPGNTDPINTYEVTSKIIAGGEADD